ncbi:MAG: hypothetical protein ABSH02_17330 [Candidatus Sulfotelmatobacter sp.]|jgi:hypothetical protein
MKVLLHFAGTGLGSVTVYLCSSTVLAENKTERDTTTTITQPA